jgi:hypothetical protein
VYVSHGHGIEHGPQDIEFELQNSQRVFLLFPGDEIIQGDAQAVFNIAARFIEPAAKILGTPSMGAF